MNNIVNLEINKFSLQNGLKVITLEDHFIPIVSYFTFFKVGSRNEIPGITGIESSKYSPDGSFSTKNSENTRF